MPKQPRDIEQLLQDQGIKTILEYFLIRGGENQGIKFSEIKKYTGIEPSSTLYGKLQQLKRKNILSQKSKGGPYFLARKYYNYVFHKHILDIFSNLSPKAMMASYGKAERSRAIYGIYPDFLDSEDKKKLSNTYYEITALLKEIKMKQIKKVLEKQIEKIQPKIKNLHLSKEEKEFFWKFSRSESWIGFGSVLYTEIGGYPDKEKIKETIKKYLSLDEEWKINLVIKILSILLPSFDYIYPLRVGYFVYEDLNLLAFLKAGICPENQNKFEITPEEKTYMDISSYSLSREKEVDYVYYVYTQTELAKERKNYAYTYNYEEEMVKADKDLEYWQHQKNALNDKLDAEEQEKYEKKTLDWIKAKFAGSLFELLWIDDMDALQNNPPNLVDEPKKFLDYDTLRCLRFWAKEYGRIKEGSKIRFKDLKEEEIKQNIEIHRFVKHDNNSYDVLYKKLKERVEYFLDKYC